MRQRDRVASLVIDTANQLTPGIKPGEPLAMWLGRSAAGIRHVLGLAKQHSLRPVFVTESPHKSEAHISKFKKRWGRKMAQTNHCKRSNFVGYPHNAELMVAELALQAGVPVLCDERHEADAVAATYALQSSHETLILSRDSDYGRYDGGALCDRIFYAPVVPAVISGSKLDLRKTAMPKARSLQDRQTHALECLPPDFQPPFVESAAHMLRIRAGGELLVSRVACPWAERDGGKGSLLAALRPFRRALYTKPVREVYPFWDSHAQAVQWVDELVEPQAGGALPRETSRLRAATRMCPATLARAALEEVGGAFNDQHAEAALLMACELTARARETSTLVEWERACSSSGGKALTMSSSVRVPVRVGGMTPAPVSSRICG